MAGGETKLSRRSKAASRSSAKSDASSRAAEAASRSRSKRDGWSSWLFSRRARRMLLPLTLLGIVVVLSVLGVVVMLVPNDRLPTRTAFLEVAPSAIPGAGLGLFLSKDSTSTARRGAVLTRYGGEDVKLTPETQNLIRQEYALGNPNRPGYMRMAGPWIREVPFQVKVFEPVGHLINDAAIITRDMIEDRDNTTLKQLVSEYYRVSEGRQNVLYKDGALDGSFDMTASRDVKPGEELYMSYGEMYWLHRVMEDPEVGALTRLRLYVYASTAHSQRFLNGYIYQDEFGTIRLSTTRQPADEEFCKSFATGYLKIEDEDDEVLEEAGISGGMPYVEQLRRLMALAAKG